MAYRRPGILPQPCVINSTRCVVPPAIWAKDRTKRLSRVRNCAESCDVCSKLLDFQPLDSLVSAVTCTKPHKYAFVCSTFDESSSICLPASLHRRHGRGRGDVAPHPKVPLQAPPLPRGEKSCCSTEPICWPSRTSTVRRAGLQHQRLGHVSGDLRDLRGEERPRDHRDPPRRAAPHRCRDDARGHPTGPRRPSP